MRNFSRKYQPRRYSHNFLISNCSYYQKFKKRNISKWVDYVLLIFFYSKDVLPSAGKMSEPHQQLCSVHTTITYTCHVACWKHIYCHKKTEYGSFLLLQEQHFLLSTFKMELLTDPVPGSRLTIVSPAKMKRHQWNLWRWKSGSKGKFYRLIVPKH